MFASLANRSTAYAKAGPDYYSQAIEDAKRCQTLEPTSSVGYLKHAAVLLVQHSYQESLVPLQEGVSAVTAAITDGSGDGKADENYALNRHKLALEHALVGAQRAMVWEKMPGGAKAALNMMAAHEACQWRTAKAELGSTTAVQKKWHQEKAAALYEQVVANHLILTDEIESISKTCTADRDLWDMLFFFTLDTTGRGVVKCQHLVPVVTGGDLAKKETLDKILKEHSVDDYESDLTADAFAEIMQQFAINSQVVPASTAMSIVSALTKTTKESLQKAAALTPHEAKELRVMSLFSVLDHEGGDTISFRDMAGAIYAWAHDKKQLDPSLLSHTKLLLMMDSKDTRRLDYAQFGKLLLSLTSTWNASLDDVVDDLIVAFTKMPTDEVALPDELLKDLIAVGDDTEATPGSVDALTYARTKQLFDLFDVDGDGSIDFSELLKGLRKYQQASSKQTQTLDGSFKGAANMQAEKIALMIMGHDEDHNQTLDPDEFAIAMVDYSKASETDLHELIDFMCVTVQKGDDDTTYEKAYSEATAAAAFRDNTRSREAFRHNSMLMTISDVEEDEGSGEED